MKALRNSQPVMPAAKRYPKKTIKLAVQLNDEGKTVGEIARRVRANKSTVSRWLQDPERYIGPATPPKPPAEPSTTPPEPAAETPPVDEAPAPPVQSPAPTDAPPLETTPDWEATGFAPVVPGAEPALVDCLDDSKAPDGPLEPSTAPDRSLAPADAANAARAIMNPVVRTVDGRLTAQGADPISEEEKAALVEAWTPIIAKWLEGPEAPIVVACVTTGVVLGPRVAQVRAAQKAAGEETAVSVEHETVGDANMAAVHAALRGEA